jgi:putative transposase
MSLKNGSIRDTLKKTKERRRTQTCKQYELKIDTSHLSDKTHQQLDRLFLEAKWFHNHVLANGNVFEADYRIASVCVKTKDGFETREIRGLSSQMKQELIDRMRDNIRSLSGLKNHGHKVGALQFKSYIGSIPLKQQGTTYWIIDKHRVHIQGIKQRLKVRGLFQIPANAELASALLIRKHGDYYLHVTTYQTKPFVEKRKEALEDERSVGIDLGIKNQLTLSNGIRINYEVPITDQMKKLCRKLSKKKYYSHNWWKVKTKLDKAYDLTTSIKKDIRNKIVHQLTERFDVICYQDDPIKAWQRIWGRRILNTSLGGIISALEKKARTPRKVNRFIPTTGICSRCGARNQVTLADRIYECAYCGLVMDRDRNSAIDIEQEGTGVPTVRRELTPGDTLASTLMEYFNSIPYVKASMVVETGSPALVVEKPTILSRG